MKSRGFTLVELVVVIAILGILGVIATSKFLNIQRDARVSTIEALRGSFISAQQLVNASALMPNALIPVGSSTKGQQYLDVNRNGVIDYDSDTSQGTFEGKDGADILLMSNLMVDNHQLLKIVDISEPLVAVIGEYNHQAYIGFDTLKNDDIREGNCRVYYDQNSFQMRTDGC